MLSNRLPLIYGARVALSANVVVTVHEEAVAARIVHDVVVGNPQAVEVCGPLPKIAWPLPEMFDPSITFLSIVMFEPPRFRNTADCE